MGESRRSSTDPDPPPSTLATDTIVIVGPTAGGKTALSIELARRAGAAEIVSADSMQVYRGMDVGTAKPSLEERAGIRHHMLDVADPHQGDFTLAMWLRGARQAIEGIHGRGSLAIVVGGTSLYARALLEGIAEVPSGSDSLRRELESMPLDAARRRLESLDPESARRIHANDRRRTIRALELLELTGRPASEVRRQWSDAPVAAPPGVLLAGIHWEIDALNRRINERVRRMFAGGLVEEVRRLLDAGPLTRQAIEAVGYREVAACLAGSISLETAIEQTKIRSRRLGKQQRTWMRRFRLVPGSRWLDGTLPTEMLAEELVKRAVIGRSEHSP